MADPTGSDEKFVEIEGQKFKEDPENEGQALLDEAGEKVPYEEQKAPEAPEPQVRRSAKDYILERKDRKIKKLEKERDEEEGGEDEELTPEGQAALDRRIDERLGPITQAAKRDADETEFREVLAEFPQAKAMEKEIRKYMEHEAYKDVPVKFIFLGLAGLRGGLIDSEGKKKTADEEAAKVRTGGHPQRRTEELPRIPDVSKMSDAQVDDLVFKVKTGQYET